MKRWIFRLVPWALFALFAADIVAILMPKPDKDFHLQDFGRLPVLLNGRVQPFDSVGRNALLQIRGTTAVPVVEGKSYEFWKHPLKLKATGWLAEVMMKPEVADTRPIFLVHHPDLLDELELRGKGREKSGLFYFSFDELTNAIPLIDQEGRRVAAIEPQSHTAYQKQVAKLQNALILYSRLKNGLQPEDVQDFAADLRAYQKSIAPGVAAMRVRDANKDFDRAAFDEFTSFLGQYDEMARMAYPLVVPPLNPRTSREDWRNMGQALFDAGVHGAQIPPVVGWLGQMASAYRQGDASKFNKALAEYREWLAANMQPESKKGCAEFFFNNLQAFLHAMIIYLCAFVLSAGAMLTMRLWPNGSEALRRSAFYLTALALVVHTAGLVFRMWLERRPPVTNLYSSAIFVGWVTAVLGLFLERIYRVGIGAAVASFIGFVTLVIAHNLSLGGDTVEMMRAVLATNFWLATHVVTITLGYAATFMAGFLGVLYVLLGLFTPLLSLKLGSRDFLEIQSANCSPFRCSTRNAGPSTNISQALCEMVYGIICFAMLFSFVGTVTGGLWADVSWGRFWGWDPKENGALIIVLWNAVILHAWWDGMVRERGLMNLAIFGNVVTSISWFGVNMLGVGLHSYGFMDAAFKWLILFVASQVVLIILGLLPLSMWRSFRAQTGPELQR
jgi:ABC-type transport system involved in cytochrome c biogenesis permease subunit